MDNQSRNQPLLAIRELKRSHISEAMDNAAPAVAAVASALLAIRGACETEARIVELLHQVTSASWVALYRGRSEVYQCREATPLGADELELIPSAIVQTTLRAAGEKGYTERAHDLVPFAPPSIAAAAALRFRDDAEPALLIFGREPGSILHPAGFEVLPHLLGLCTTALQNAELIERLRSQVYIDHLTDCFNRRAFEEHMTVELVRARRYGRSLCLLMLDLDDFKAVNDEFGHPSGDYALRCVGELLRGAFRTTDRVCRFGGDEFAVLFPETPKEEVLRLAERIRRKLESRFPDEVVPQAITASIGVAAYPADGVTTDDVVRAADTALYRAKAEGRNRVGWA
jgi:diguanylate cyclase (GGDEF)-like protein